MASTPIVTEQELSGIISKPACYCLNQHPSFPYTNLFVGDGKQYNFLFTSGLKIIFLSSVLDYYEKNLFT